MAGPVICLPVDVLCSSGLEVLGSGPGTIPVAEVIDAIPQFMAVAVEGGLAIEIDETPWPLCPACAVGFMASRHPPGHPTPTGFTSGDLSHGLA